MTVVTLLPGYIDTPLTRENRSTCPFLMQADDFAERAFRAVEAGSSYRVIPWRVGVTLLLRVCCRTRCSTARAGRSATLQAPSRASEAPTVLSVALGAGLPVA